MKRFALTSLLVLAIAAPAASAADHGIGTSVMSINGRADVVHAPPSSPCNTAHVMDLVITDDGVWFECVCEKLVIGVVCDWYELGPAPDATAARKRLWRYVSRATQHQLLITHRWPRFVTPPKRVQVHAPTKITATPTAAAVTTTKCTDPYLADDAWAQVHGC